MKKTSALLLCLAIGTAIYAHETATFEDITISHADTIYQLEESGLFTSGGFQFEQEAVDYGGEYGKYWFGWVVSNQTDTTYSYYADAYNAACGHGVDGSSNYAVWYSSWNGFDRIRIDEATCLKGCYVNNTTWVVSSIRDGDGMGGTPFGEKDYLSLTVYGYVQGQLQDSVVFYLAANGAYLTEWTWVDMTALGKVDELRFAIDGSQKTEYGLTTPAYFCMDNLTADEQTDIPIVNTASTACKLMTTRGLQILRNGRWYDVLGR